MIIASSLREDLIFFPLPNVIAKQQKPQKLDKPVVLADSDHVLFASA